MVRVVEHRESSRKKPDHEDYEMKPPEACAMSFEFIFECCRLGLKKAGGDRFFVGRMGFARIVGGVGDSYSAACSHGFHDADGVYLHSNMKRTLGHYF